MSKQRPQFANAFRFVLLTLCGIGMLHIIVTVAAPSLTSGSAYARLSGKLPLNTMKLMPPLTPETQPLPFMGADARYAMCRFDTTKGPVAVSARLPEAGWTLAVYSANGDSLYLAAGDAGQRGEINIVLVPSDDRFLGLTPEAGGTAPGAVGAQSLAARRGLVVVRAPDRGLAYRALAAADLARASCNARPF